MDINFYFLVYMNTRKNSLSVGCIFLKISVNPSMALRIYTMKKNIPFYKCGYGRFYPTITPRDKYIDPKSL